MRGLHDITMTQLPPHRKPYLIMAPEDRIGTTYIPVDTEKIVAIIESDYQDQTVANSPADETSQAIARHLIEFLEHEVSRDRLPKNLLPLQSGIGNIANAVIGGLAESKFEHLKVWTEVNLVLEFSKSELLLKAAGLARYFLGSLRLWPSRLCNCNLNSIFSRGVQTILRWMGAIPQQAPPEVSTSFQFTRDHPETWRYWNEHTRRSRHLRSRKQYLCDGISHVERPRRFCRFPSIGQI